MADHDVRLVPDLDEELVHALGQVEELLLTLAGWEADPDDPLALPPPLAGERALAALHRVQDAVGPTQTREGHPGAGGWAAAGPGRALRAPAAAPGAPQPR